MLNEASDVDSLALDVVDKCKLISKSKLDLVKDILRYLQQRKFMEDNGIDGTSPRFENSFCSRAALRGAVP